MKYFCVLFYLFAFLIGHSQVKKDTIIVINKTHSSLAERKKSIYFKFIKDTIFAVKSCDSKSLQTVWDYLSNNVPYCKFYDKKGRIIEEGKWFGEGFTGEYKIFYTNGLVKAEGKYNNSAKIQKWKYYSDKGKLVKVENYSDQGILIP